MVEQAIDDLFVEVQQTEGIDDHAKQDLIDRLREGLKGDNKTLASVLHNVRLHAENQVKNDPERPTTWTWSFLVHQWAEFVYENPNNSKSERTKGKYLRWGKAFVTEFLKLEVSARVTGLNGTHVKRYTKYMND